MILLADKGKVTVVMNRDDYNSKMETLLQSTDYESVKKDPTAKLEKKLNDILAQGAVDNRREQQSSISQVEGFLQCNPTVIWITKNPQDRYTPKTYCIKYRLANLQTGQGTDTSDLPTIRKIPILH